MDSEVLTKKTTRNIPERTKIKLAVVSGGRCEFQGCNDYLFYHPITLQDGNFSEHAHIYPFGERGPRGGSGIRPDEIHSVDNLMLICQGCHKLIDDNEDEYTIGLLREMKAEHEERIQYVTSFTANNKSHALILKGFILDRASDITFDQIREAMSPMYPVDRKGMTLDLTQFGKDLNSDYFEQSAKYITRQIEKFYERDIEHDSPRHVSVFALASIPLLVHLGRQLSDKIPVELFHRHRDSDKPWQWQKDTTPLALEINCLRKESVCKDVGIVISISGKVQLADIPSEIKNKSCIYEISVVGQIPNVRLLNTRDDLQHFWKIYAKLLAMIGVEHPDCTDLHLFLAAPPPVAIICGHERLPKVQPALRLYDNIYDPETNRRRFEYRLCTR